MRDIDLQLHQRIKPRSIGLSVQSQAIHHARDRWNRLWISTGDGVWRCYGSLVQDMGTEKTRLTEKQMKGPIF